MALRLLITLIFISSLAQAQFWTENASGFPLSSTGLSKIHIVDDNVVWATGYDGINPNVNVQRFTTSSDAGTTWTAGTINVGNANLGISNISGVNATTAYVAVHPRGAGQQGGVWQTTDTGATWTRQTSAAFNSASSFANVVHYFNTNDGVAIGDPAGGFWEIYTTTDGGTTYTRVPTGNIPAPLTNEVGYLAQYTFLGDNLWFTTSTGRVYHSANKGMNWTVFQSPLSDFGGTNLSGDISFSTPNKGLIQDNSGNLFITQDAGQTWNVVTISGTGFPYGGAIAYIPGTTRVVSTGGDSALAGTSYSTNDGTTWINVSTNQHVDVAFLDEDTGYSGGFSTVSTQGGVFIYSDTVLSNVENRNAADFTLYPNPATDMIHVQGTRLLEKIELYDLNGRLLFTEIENNTIDVSRLYSGTYFIKITTENDNFTTQKLLKK